MTLIYTGIAFGLFIGTGIFLLMIYPALKERKRENEKS